VPAFVDVEEKSGVCNLENTRVPVDATDEESPVEMMEVKNKETRTI
jgi:hypothetical protein